MKMQRVLYQTRNPNNYPDAVRTHDSKINSTLAHWQCECKAETKLHYISCEHHLSEHLCILTQCYGSDKIIMQAPPWPTLQPSYRRPSEGKQPPTIVCRNAQKIRPRPSKIDQDTRKSLQPKGLRAYFPDDHKVIPNTSNVTQHFDQCNPWKKNAERNRPTNRMTRNLQWNGLKPRR